MELAQRVNLTNTPCSERVKRLERSGYITGYRATLDLEKLGLVQVSLSATGGDNSLDAFNRAVRAIPEVESCVMTAGSFDYLLTVRTRDMRHFRDVLGERINKLPGILQTHSFAVMEVVKLSAGTVISGSGPDLCLERACVQLGTVGDCCVDHLVWVDGVEGNS